MEKTPPRHPDEGVQEKKEKKDQDRGKKEDMGWDGSLQIYLTFGPFDRDRPRVSGGCVASPFMVRQARHERTATY